MSRLMSYFGEKEARILVLGLDNAGKTTILCKLPRPRVCRSACVNSRQDVYNQQLASLPAPVLLPCFADRLQVGEVVSTIPSKPRQQGLQLPELQLLILDQSTAVDQLHQPLYNTTCLLTIVQPQQ